MSYKKFSLSIFVALVLFVILNFIIWEVATKEILKRKDPNIITGNQARMGYLPNFNHERKNETNLLKQHMNHFGVSNEIDMITIGDSFSNGGAGGLNRFYQDYLATYTGMKILNIQQLKTSRSYLETIVMLYNSGILKKYGVKYVLVESTQRKIVERFSSYVDYKAGLNKTYSLNDIFKKTDEQVLNLPDIKFVNNGNFKYLAYSLLYHFSPNAFISKVYKVKLTKPLFSIGEGNDLLFSGPDIKSIPKNTRQNIEKVNASLNEVAGLLKNQDIKLIFLPAVSKYDLYRDFIKKKEDFPKDPLFDFIREMEKSYIFIDTKALLLKELNKGVKDIFYIDDTHWSYKASDIISEAIKEKISK